MFSANILALGGAVLSFLPGALAGYSSGAYDNVVIYWGQNSARKSTSQKRLSEYCSNTNLDVIPLAFLSNIKNPTLVNFASAGDRCDTFSGTQLLSCPEIEQDIKTCQSLNKTILLSIGGATYTEGGFTSSSEATTWANTIWAMFGPPQQQPSSNSAGTINRPFGSAIIDGFDLDFEATSANMVPFANQLRSNMDSSSGNKKYYLSIAPQCPYPDAANNELLQSVKFDFVAVQFYNNYCGVQAYVPGSASQNNFNFETWDTWAKKTSKNPAVKILLGIPGSATAAGGGYVNGSQLSAVVAYSKLFSSFGGVMVWDMSQVFGNSGFLDGVVAALGGGIASPPPPSPLTTATATFTTSTRSGTTQTSAPTPTSNPGGLVVQWGQCGGKGYTGPTQCQEPYICMRISEWWSQCM